MEEGWEEGPLVRRGRGVKKVQCPCLNKEIENAECIIWTHSEYITKMHLGKKNTVIVLVHLEEFAYWARTLNILYSCMIQNLVLEEIYYDALTEPHTLSHGLLKLY